MHPDIVEQCWAFVRNDLDAHTFESWLYITHPAESVLGAELYLDAISTDFGNGRQVANLRAKLRHALPSPAACACHQTPSRRCVTMGRISLENFEHLERGVLHMFWVHHYRCNTCGSDWTLYEEGRIYDVWMVFRGWKDYVNVRTYRDLLTLAISMGASVRYDQPEVSVEIPWTIEDLARETPGISVRDIAALIPVPLKVVKRHARRVVDETGVHIKFES